jgi:hypothetical protein
MRRTLLRLVAVAGILAVPFAVQAHDPPDLILPAVQFPDGNTPIIDGNLDDWAPVPPEQYGVFTEQMCPVGSSSQEGGPNEDAICGGLDPSDMAFTHMTGWNESGNWFYWTSEVFDDVKVARRQDPGRFYWDDSIEYQLNYRHEALEDFNGGEGGTIVTSVDYNYGIPPVDGAYEFYRPLRNLPWLVNGTQWVTLGWTWDGEFVDGAGTYFYEFRVRPIAEMPLSEDATEDQVVIGDLSEGQIVHWGQMVNDADEGDGSTNFRKAQWSLAPSGGNAAAVTDVLLAPMDPGITWGPPRTAVEATSWGRIKAQF